MSEKEAKRHKPDGWVAWHPERKITAFRDSEINCLRLAARELKGVKGPMQYDSIETWEKNEDYAISKMKKEGWRIRPVKLVFLDEEENGEG